MSYSAILFDLDGTLLNTIPDLWHSANYALKQLGYPERTLEEVTSFVGNGVRMLMKRALPEDVPESVWNEAVRLQKGYYSQNLAVDTKPYDGIIPLLQRLKLEGFLLGTVSNKYNEASQEIIKIYFPGMFDVVIGSTDDLPLKPDRALVDLALSRLGVSSGQAIYVGDSDVDYLTAVNSGLKPVLVDWGFRSRDTLISCGADNIISSPDALLKIVGF